MHSQFHLNRVILLAILIAGAALALAAFVYNQQGAAASMQAPPDPSSERPLSPDAAARNCTISNLYVTDNRWHVRCTTALPAGVYYFAIENDAAHKIQADRMLVLANTAYALSKPIEVWYETSTASNPTGCLTSDCRRLSGVVVKP